MQTSTRKQGLVVARIAADASIRQIALRQALLALVVAITMTIGSIAFATASTDVSRWDFTVYLNDKRVGTHLFEVVDEQGMRRVQSEASFDYKILFITAYKYRHENEERWSDNCLLGLEARTNANGETLAVSGEKTDSGFVVRAGDEPEALPQCVMTFAYWNPDFLQQTQLLNPQTGQFMPVTVELEGTEPLQVRGESVSARRYKLTADEVDVTLWYSSDDQWLALESVAKGGHIIRYELS